jgi:hypothetical protein
MEKGNINHSGTSMKEEILRYDACSYIELETFALRGYNAMCHTTTPWKPSYMDHYMQSVIVSPLSVLFPLVDTNRRT